METQSYHIDFIHRMVFLIAKFLKRFWRQILALGLFYLGDLLSQILYHQLPFSKNSYWKITTIADSPSIIFSLLALYLSRDIVRWNVSKIDFKIKIFTLLSIVHITAIWSNFTISFFPSTEIFTSQNKRSEEIKKVWRQEEPLIDFVSPILVAPVTEEGLYRQGMLSFGTNTIAKVSLLGLSSLFFTLGHHENYNWIMYFTLFPIGITLGILYFKFGLKWSMLCHSFLNFSVWLSDGSEISDLYLNLRLAIFLLWFVFLLYYLSRVILKFARRSSTSHSVKAGSIDSELSIEKRR